MEQKIDRLKPEELRIGNHVRIARKHTIDENIIQISANGILQVCDEILEVNPIPITEDLLKRFGFENATNGYWDSNDEFRIYPDGKGVMYLGERIPCEDIRYVHQLQNLYFALTGEELKIKE